MYNKAIIMGRLTADPELRQTPSNISVTSFTVACDRAYSKGADRQTDFIDCVDGSKNSNPGDSGNVFSAPAASDVNNGVAYSSGNAEDFEEIGGLDDLPC